MSKDAPATPASVVPAEAGAAPVPLAIKPREGVRYEGFDIKIAEPGENKIPAYEVSSLFPVSIVLGIATLILWIVAPGGIQLLRPRPVSSAFVDASARWTLVLTAQRIESFEATNARLPQSLEELDANVPDVLTYQRLPDGGFILQAPGQKGRLVLDSKTPREPFLAGSNPLLRKSASVAP